MNKAYHLEPDITDKSLLRQAKDVCDPQGV